MDEMTKLHRPAAVPGSATGLRRLSWERLLRLAAGADCIALFVVAAILGDLEAAVVGVGFAVGLALLRFRSGLLGRILLGLASANVLGWMSLGAISNIVNGEGLGALVIPAALAVLSLAGLVAAVASGVHRRSASPTAAPGTFAATLAGLLIAMLVAGAVVPGSGAASARAGDLVVTAKNVRFTDTELTAQPGDAAVVLHNGDLFWHTFTIDELQLDLAVPVGGQRRASFTAEPGTYEFYCRIPGHEALMRGTLTVQ